MPTANHFKEHYGQILFLLGVFLIFMAIATGFIQIVINSGQQTGMLPDASTLRLGHIPPGLAGSPEFITLILAGLVLSLLLPVLPPVTASLLPLAAMIPPIAINYASPARHVLIPMEFSLLGILLLYAVNVLISYFRETRSRQRIMNIFGQYVPPQVVAEISRYPERINLAGESRKMTVFFCDLKNFSNVAEQLNPRQLALLLNEYFTVMTEILYRYQATIDKYIGDSIMAFWGAPLSHKDDAERSVLCAFEMQREMLSLSEKFSKKGWPALSMGIGINTGTMNVGNMGSRYRIAYTVVGDAVNLASRLEGLTRIYHVPTVVSETTMQESDGILYRELDVVQVKGKRKKTKIYQPICIENEADDSVHDMLQYHGEAIASYHDAEWGKAEKLFSYLAKNYPDDGFYIYMLDRVADKQGKGKSTNHSV